MPRSAQVAAELIAHCLQSGLDTDEMLMALAVALGCAATCCNVRREAMVALLVQQMMRAAISEANRAAHEQGAGREPDAGWLS